MKEAIGNKQIVFILFASIVGFPFSIPMDFAVSAGTCGWTIAIICALLATPPIFMISSINMHYEKRGFHEYIEDIAGKYLALAIMIFFLARYLSSTMMVAGSITRLVRLTILEFTPLWALFIVFIACCSYTSSKSLTSLSYIYEFYGLILTFIFSLLILAMLTKGDFINLRPFFVKEDMPTYLKEGFRNLIAFAGFDKLFFVPLFRKENKKIHKYLVVSILLITICYIASFEATLAVSGVNETVLYDDIFFLSIRGIELHHFDLIRRLDLFALSNFIFSSLMIVSFNLYASNVIIYHYLQKLNFRSVTIPLISVIIYIFASIICISFASIFTSEAYVKITSNMAIVASYIIPIILFTIVKVKNYEKKTL
ncbi:spore germination protein [Clostridium pascui]|uniref:GerAB/ArcD/ProY family transporter n=1 Tax=Clostridium pascui TaxID=46609 RepID=UPI00195ADE9F|nr:GerAB/ArcD/ProY family transporter [Clostridium pascui]MBM7871752.1 spore germination protein [Clostridium pascui]